MDGVAAHEAAASASAEDDRRMFWERGGENLLEEATCMKEVSKSYKAAAKRRAASLHLAKGERLTG